MSKFKWLYTLLLCVIFYSVNLNAQNPFELTHRLDSLNIVPVTEYTGNPFDMVRVNPVGKDEFELTERPKIRKKVENKSVDTKIDKKKRENFLFWAVTSMLVLLTLLFTLYKSLVNKVYKAFLNDNFLKLLQREQGGWLGIPMLLLYILYFINAGIFAFLVIDRFNLISTKNNLLLLSYCVGIIAGISFLKHLILILLSWIFPVNKVVRHYNFTIIVFSVFIGLILIPFNVFIAFTFSPLAKYLIYGAFGIILLIYCFRALRGLLISSSYLSFHKFHFFMYLCTVEIAPVLVLLRLILDGQNL